MAKLSARGRTKLAQVEKVTEIDQAETDAWSITRERVTYALMSDNKILKKRDVWFKRDGKQHNWGWKVHGKLKKGLTVENWIDLYLQHGFKQTA